MKGLFQRHGLPEIIRTDNGHPFGSKGPAGLSQLSAWWTSLGIRVEHIAPGHPEQNGSHEQFHAELKAEAIQPPPTTLRAALAAAIQPGTAASIAGDEAAGLALSPQPAAREENGGSRLSQNVAATARAPSRRNQMARASALHRRSLHRLPHRSPSTS